MVHCSLFTAYTQENLGVMADLQIQLNEFLINKLMRKTKAKGAAPAAVANFLAANILSEPKNIRVVLLFFFVFFFWKVRPLNIFPINNAWTI